MAYARCPGGGRSGPGRARVTSRAVADPRRAGPPWVLPAVRDVHAGFTRSSRPGLPG